MLYTYATVYDKNTSILVHIYDKKSRILPFPRGKTRDNAKNHIVYDK